jgi:hypothetical protein
MEGYFCTFQTCWIKWQPPFVALTLRCGAKGEKVQISASKIPPQASSPPPVSLPTITKNLWEGISAPFKYAESNDGIRLFLWLLVAELQAKRSKFLSANFRPKLVHHQLYPFQLQQKFRGRVFLHLSNTLNRMVIFVCCSDSWLWSHGQKRSKFR